MSKNTTIWLIIEFFCYFLIFYLVPDLINSINERSKQNSASIIDRITLIAETDQNIIYQIEKEAREQQEARERQQQLRESQRQLRESQRQRYEQQQQEWNDQQQQWKDRQREQQEYREMRRQQQEKDREMRRQQQERNERIYLRRENF